ncbi:MAG: radical SAM protein [Desulfovibrionaceae bacterium]|nr:radical SAM protein [Desulfovibrionaceae bacterium]
MRPCSDGPAFLSAPVLHAGQNTVPQCRVIAWEVTRRCNLACVHCRASAKDIPYALELKREEALALADSFQTLGRPLIIFTGGEPLLRPDLFGLIRAVRKNGHKAALSVNGTLISPEIIEKIKDVEISRCSVSIDGGSPAAHDAFRGAPGCFEQAVNGIRQLVRAGVPVQLNTTITYRNYGELPAILNLCRELGAAAWHIFLLVPVGRGAEVREITPQMYEQALTWIYEQARSSELEIRPTCAPQYNCLTDESGSRQGRGCLGGVGFCFVSHTGIVQPCGYLQLDCGDVRVQSVSEIWRTSAVFQQLRNPGSYSGACASCRLHSRCGGCRARAHEHSGNFLAHDPICPIVKV